MHLEQSDFCAHHQNSYSSTKRQAI